MAGRKQSDGCCSSRTEREHSQREGGRCSAREHRTSSDFLRFPQHMHTNMQLLGRVVRDNLSTLLFIALIANESLAMRPSTRLSAALSKDSSQKVVILGAGIHGASVAHYLSSRFGILPTVVERVSVAAAASGKAGGFLAREWGSGATQQLHQVSFDMHEKLGN